MSFTNATPSGLIKNIIFVFDQTNITSPSSIPNSSRSCAGFTACWEANSTTAPHYDSDPCVSAIATTAVTYGIPQGKIIAVVTMLIIFSIFGCLGNGLVLYVFSKKSDKVTSTIFILALAWTDFFMCLIFMPFTVVYIQLDGRLYLDFFCKMFHFLSTSSVPLSAFIMVAIAVDRYFSICHPFMHVVTPRRARVAIVTLVLVAFTLGSITACIYGVHKGPTTSDEPIPGRSAYNKSADNLLLQDRGNQSEATITGQVTDWSQMSTTINPEMVAHNITYGKSSSGPAQFGNHHNSQSPELQDCGGQDSIQGLCVELENIFSSNFRQMYQKIYISFYIVSLLAVFTLYFFIYRSVAERRKWRRKQKSWSHSPMSMTVAMTTVENSNRNACAGEGENLELSPQTISQDVSQSDSKDSSGGFVQTPGENVTSTGFHKTASDSFRNNCSHENGMDSNYMLSSAAEKKANRERRDFNFLANIRTAIMLFVVALVFIVSFLPAWLMATQLIEYEIIIFYMHFLYNVANPVIYAFMNQSFRKELKRVFQRGTHLFQGG